MENNDVGNTVPTAAEHDGLQVSGAAAAAAEVKNRFENGGGSGRHEGVVVAPLGVVGNGGGEGGFKEKRKRGRPRKQLGEFQPEFRVVAAEDSGGVPQKRGRGRPRGSGKWQTLAASLGVRAPGQTAGGGGSNFTPYIIEIQAGENIVERIWSFSQMTNDSICILSASGTVSLAEIFLPASRGRYLKYEGHYTIVCLNGSHTYDEKRSGRNCLLSVQLANSDGRFHGGAVAGRLIADGPTQVIISTFKQDLRQQASIRPSSTSTPNPNNNENGRIAAAIPLLVENGRLSESEAREEDEDEDGDGDGDGEEEQTHNIYNGGTTSSSAHTPTDWKSMQPHSDV